MKKIYSILTLLALTVLTSFGVFGFVPDTSKNDIYVLASRQGYNDQYSMPYDTEYIYFVWEVLEYNAVENETLVYLGWYNQDNVWLLGDERYFYMDENAELIRVDFFVPLSFYTDNESAIQYIFEQNILYTKAIVYYNGDDGVTISFNDSESSDFSLPSGLGQTYTSPNISVVTPYNFYQSGVSKGYDDGYNQGFSDGVNNDRSYQDGLKDGYDAGYDDGLRDGEIAGQQLGYDAAREFYGYYDNGQWFTAETWGDMRYNSGASSNINVWGVMGNTFFNSIGAIGSIEVLPGLQLWFLVAFPLIIGIIKFIAGGDTNDSKKGKGGKK